MFCTFFRISCFVVQQKNTFIQVWIYLRVSQLWFFGSTCLFKKFDVHSKVVLINTQAAVFCIITNSHTFLPHFIQYRSFQSTSRKWVMLIQISSVIHVPLLHLQNYQIEICSGKSSIERGFNSSDYKCISRTGSISILRLLLSSCPRSSSDLS